MQSSAERRAARKRTDNAVWQLLLAIAVAVIVSFFVDWLWAFVIGLALSAAPLSVWFAAEFRAWDQGGPAGELARAVEESNRQA